MVLCMVARVILESTVGEIHSSLSLSTIRFGITLHLGEPSMQMGWGKQSVGVVAGIRLRQRQTDLKVSSPWRETQRN